MSGGEGGQVREKVFYMKIKMLIYGLRGLVLAFVLSGQREGKENR